MGRKKKESLPYCSATSGCLGPTTPRYTQFDYDSLGRLVRQTHPDGTYVETVYSGQDVEIRDENCQLPGAEKCRVTEQAWRAFGSPDDRQLVRVTDATGHEWSYSYNAVGKLTQVVAPNSVVRSWTYRPTQLDLLAEETHPESAPPPVAPCDRNRSGSTVSRCTGPEPCLGKRSRLRRRTVIRCWC